MIYEIAGLKVEMEPKFERLMKQSESYQSSGDPFLIIKPDPNDEMHVDMNVTSKGDQEYICYSAAFCRSVIQYGRFYLHASAIVYQGEAYLFSAPSGTGKSTHTALWRQLFLDSYILNDDKPIICPEDNRITVWGTPFAGKTDLHVNQGVPLKAICFLKQGKENVIQQVSEDKALALILNNTWRPKSNDGMNRLLDMIEQVVTKIKIYEMSCTKELEAAQISYEIMKGK